MSRDEDKKGNIWEIENPYSSTLGVLEGYWGFIYVDTAVTILSDYCDIVVWAE